MERTSTAWILSSITSTLEYKKIKAVGPIPNDFRTSDVPYRVKIQATLPSGKGVSRDFTTLVEFAGPGPEEESLLRVFGRWKEKELERSVLATEAESVYSLVELKWLPANE